MAEYMKPVAAVQSFRNKNHWYRIDKLATGRWTCSCPSHRFQEPDEKGVKRPCKHLLHAWWLVGKGIQKYDVPVKVFNLSAFGKGAPHGA